MKQENGDVQTKQAYEKPEVVYRQSMESVASACDTNAGGKGDEACSVLNS